MILIKNSHVIDPENGIDGIMDVVIEGSNIKYIGVGPEDGSYDRIIDGTGLTTAPGLVDIHVHFRDPGLTHKEDIHTGAAAAAQGGFTTVVCMANTQPPIDNVDTLRYVIEEGRKTPIHVLAAATISKNMEGLELTDMEALKAAGAAGFTDDGKPLMDKSMVKKAMEEARRLNLPLSFHEEDPAFITNNGINQGMAAEKLGLTGSPALAEDVMVARDCMLALHTGAAIDIQHMSSGSAVKMVRLAKELGAHVAAEVTPHHFTLTEEAVLEYGALAKMNPPLRTEQDRQALIEGLKDGTITIIATDHAPHSAEEKSRPLTEAPSGIIGLETALALGITHLVKEGHLTISQLVEKMSLNPARFYHLDCGSLGVDKTADLVIFDENQVWTVDKFASKSSNSPFIGQTLYGKVKYTICNGRIVYSDKKYHTILLDVDGTLLDFDAAERASIQDILKNYQITPTQKLLEAYHVLNQRYWHDFELGLITKEQIMGRRFTEYFQNLGVDIDGDEAEALHRDHLNHSAILIEGALELCDYLSRNYEVYIVTNGVSDTQYQRLSQSGLDQYFRGVFVSEDAKSQKPSKEFFDYCLSGIRNPDPSGMLIIGDSLTSDIRGGNIAGIDTCWYNPHHLDHCPDIHVDYEIQKLEELRRIL